MLITDSIFLLTREVRGSIMPEAPEESEQPPTLYNNFRRRPILLQQGAKEGDSSWKPIASSAA